MIIQNVSNPIVQQAAQPVHTMPSTQVSTGAAVGGATDSAVNTEQSVAAPQQISTDTLNNVVSILNQVMQQANSSLKFSVDSATNTPIVRLVDTNTGELIRQIPTEEALAISRVIDKLLQQQEQSLNPGLLCNQAA